MKTFISDYSEDFAGELRLKVKSTLLAGQDRSQLLQIGSLQNGIIAARAVCRIHVPDLSGGAGEWGTGFLITPRLLLTSNPVLKDKETAARSLAVFEINGIKAGIRFSFLPGECFMTSHDPLLAFTVIALSPLSEDETMDLSDFGFLRLIPDLNKVAEKKLVNIIQYAENGEKYMTTGKNEIIKTGGATDPFRDKLWYSSDIKVSPGALLFNEQWQVLALQHSNLVESRIVDGQREIQLTDNSWINENDLNEYSDDAIKAVAHEGIWINRIIEQIKTQHKAADTGHFELIREFLDDVDGSFIDLENSEENFAGYQALLGNALVSKVKVNLRDIQYYEGRTGFDENFLGQNIGLPKIKNVQEIAVVADTTDNVLRYTHYSIVYNKIRKMAFYAAVNIDGSKTFDLNRGTDKWFKDPRVDLDIQVGDEFYGSEPGNLGTKGYFDRGHLVRRLDPVWGDKQIAVLANDDTFHWTNCSPQYWQFNQGQDLWQGLENYILYNTDQEDVLANVYNGPVFSNDDQKHRGVLIPKYFWKVVIVKDENDQIFSSAYVVDQSKWASNIPFEIIPTGDFNHFQTTVKKLEKQTGLTFSDIIRNADVRKGKSDKKLRSLSDIDHPRR